MRMVNPTIFKEFGIDVEKCYKKRGVYICETKKGIRVIKKTEHTKEQIIIQNNIREYIYNKGFTNIDILYKSRKNEPFVYNQNKVYTMEDYHKSEDIDLTNVNDIKCIIRLLGNFHISSTGFSDDNIDIEKIRFKNLGEVYKKRYNENIKLRRKINNRSGKTDFEILYLEHVKDYMYLQEKGLELVNKKNYNELITKSKNELTITHKHFTNHNIIKTQDDKMILTGLDRSTYDVQILDLVYITRKIMSKNNWDIKLLMLIIDEYIKICPLTISQWEILKGMLIFPEKFSKLCNEYYHSKRRWNYNMFYRKLSNMLEYKEYYLKAAEKLTDA